MLIEQGIDVETISSIKIGLTFFQFKSCCGLNLFKFKT